jgi:hypothetical protein
MQNKYFLHQSNPDSPNYGVMFRDETQRRVNCPDLHVEDQDALLAEAMIAGCVLLVLAIIALWVTA